MTETKTTDARMTDETFDAICEEQAQADDLVPDGHMEYDEWLEWTGKDDSFVGHYESGVSGTADLYDAAIRILERPAPATPA